MRLFNFETNHFWNIHFNGGWLLRVTTTEIKTPTYIIIISIVTFISTVDAHCDHYWHNAHYWNNYYSECYFNSCYHQFYILKCILKHCWNNYFKSGCYFNSGCDCCLFLKCILNHYWNNNILRLNAYNFYRKQEIEYDFGTV